MLNFCPLCVAEVYALRCDVMRCRRGLRTTHYIVRPRLTTLGLEIAWAIRVVIPSTNSPMTLQRYAVFLYLQNLYLSTSKSCIKMGIPSLKSAIFYNVSLYFQSNRTNITKYPRLPSMKTPLFMDGTWQSNLKIFTEINTIRQMHRQAFGHHKENISNHPFCLSRILISRMQSNRQSNQ